MRDASQPRFDPALVAAVVPCHGEPPARDLLQAISDAVGRLVVVDDHLSAPARDRLRSAAAGLGASVVRSHRSRGKGSAIASGLEWLRSHGEPDAVLVMDADGQHPPDAIPRFLAAASRCDLVIGDRFDERDAMPLTRRLANTAASRLLAARTGTAVSDSQCGMRLLRGRALNEIPPVAGGYEAESEHLKRCLLAGVSVEWVPIPAIYDGEASHFRALLDGARVAWTVLR